MFLEESHQVVQGMETWSKLLCFFYFIFGIENFSLRRKKYFETFEGLIHLYIC